MSMTKDEIRERMRALRRKVGAARRAAVSKTMCERLLLRVRDAKLVCCYEALKTEIDLAEFIARCPCEVVVPEQRGGEYVVPRAGEVDVWICPGLAFTRAGDRIGFGGGWYDRFLAAAKPEAKKCAVAYDFQIVDELPRESHDMLLDEVLVEGVSLDWERTLGDPVMGIDEAGRGPLVGGVYAAAVSLPLAEAERLLTGAWKDVNDSKRLSEKRRGELAELIRSTPHCRWAVASASSAEIDELNILRATHLAMNRAAAEIRRSDAPGTVTRALVDGLPVKTLADSVNLVKGDARSLLVSAASILAKTARDADCLRLEAEYPGYGFAEHKGYPTPAHLASLARLGPCAEHRRSFGPVKELIGR